jgi:hypothetical protein
MNSSITLSIETQKIVSYSPIKMGVPEYSLCYFAGEVSTKDPDSCKV